MSGDFGSNEREFRGGDFGRRGEETRTERARRVRPRSASAVPPSASSTSSDDVTRHQEEGD